MKFFSLPADFRKSTIDEYRILNKKYSDCQVFETYGNVSAGSFLRSGRSRDLIPKVNFEALKEYVQYSETNGIKFNYTINSTHMNNMEFVEENISGIISFLKEIKAIGINDLTIAQPTILEIVKRTGIDFKIKASTLCGIVNVSKALAYKNKGVDRIVVDESINRDFDALEKIRYRFGENVELIANAICHKDCIYRMFHYNQMSNDSVKITNEISANFYSHRCLLQRFERISNLLKLSWIRPEDLKYYTSIGIQYFKLQGRQAVINGDPVRTVKAYFDENFEGNLFELLDMFNPTNNFSVEIDNKKLENFLTPFVKKKNFCKSDCESCHYCDNFVNGIVSIENTNEIIDLYKGFFNEYDQFKKAVESSLKSDDTKLGSREKPLDFGFDLDN